MTRILFGQRAIKREKKETEDVIYPHGSHVLGAFYMERRDSIRFKLPNGKLGIVLKRGLENDIEGQNTTLPRIMVKEFRKDIYVELLVQGTNESGYECTIFTQKMLKPNSIVTGIIEGKEEIGYSVALGIPGKSALLKTSKTYEEGELGTFQVTAVTSSTYMLGDTIDREIYIGEKSEISPGIIVRTSVTGRPRYVLGDIRPRYTRMHYSYTAEGMTISNLIVESKEELVEEDQQSSIIVFVSEDKSLIHAVPVEEYANDIHRNLPSPDLVGQILNGEVELVKKTGLSTVRLENGLLSVLYEEHYSDISRKGSMPSFSEGDTIQVCVYMINGYSVVVTAKESFIKAAQSDYAPKIGSCVIAMVKSNTPVSRICETIGGVPIIVKRVDDGTDSEIGAIKYVKVKKHTEETGYFLGTIINKTRILSPEDKENKENVENKQKKEKKQKKAKKEKKEKKEKKRRRRRRE